MFLGIRLIECVLEAKKWPKSIPKLTDRQVIVEVADLLLQANFFHRSEKVKEKKGYLKVSESGDIHILKSLYFSFLLEDFSKTFV